MKFFEYLDVIYRNKNIELTKGYDLKLQAETRSIPDLMAWQRSYYKFISYFKLVSGFLYAKVTGKYPESAPLPQTSKADGATLQEVKGEPA